MARPSVLTVLLAATLFGAGCLTGRASRGKPDPGAALARTVAAYDAATATNDPERLVRHFRPDVVVLSPQSREPAVGVEANRAAWARFFALPKAAHSIHTREMVMSVAGDLAYTRGEWTATFERPDGAMAPGSGELVTIWRRDPAAGGAEPDGEWKAAVVMAHRVR